MSKAGEKVLRGLREALAMREDETNRALDAAIKALEGYGYEYLSRGIMLAAISAYQDALASDPSKEASE